MNNLLEFCSNNATISNSLTLTVGLRRQIEEDLLEKQSYFNGYPKDGTSVRPNYKAYNRFMENDHWVGVDAPPGNSQPSFRIENITGLLSLIRSADDWSEEFDSKDRHIIKCNLPAGFKGKVRHIKKSFLPKTLHSTKTRVNNELREYVYGHAAMMIHNPLLGSYHGFMTRDQKVEFEKYYSFVSFFMEDGKISSWIPGRSPYLGNQPFVTLIAKKKL